MARSLPIKWELKPGSIKYESESTALNVRALLIRKYITRPGKEPSNYGLLIKDVLSSIKQISPDHVQDVGELVSRYDTSYERGEYVLSDGMIMSLSKLFEDIVYGIYLHSDAERIERLLRMDQAMMHQALRQFIQPLEEILSDMVRLIQEIGVPEMSKQDFTPDKLSAIVTSDKAEGSGRNLSEYWENVQGRYVSDQEALSHLFDNKSDQDNQILATALRFWNIVSDPKVATADLKDVVLTQKLSDWSDLSGVRDMMKDNNLGIGSIVNYNHRGDVAYVKLFKNVKNTFLITEEQIISDVILISLVEDVIAQEWRVFSLGGAKEPYLDRS